MRKRSAWNWPYRIEHVQPRISNEFAVVFLFLLIACFFLFYIFNPILHHAVFVANNWAFTNDLPKHSNQGLANKSVLVRMASLDFLCTARGRSLIALRYTITSIVVLYLFINLEPSELNIDWLGSLVIWVITYLEITVLNIKPNGR